MPHQRRRDGRCSAVCDRPANASGYFCDEHAARHSARNASSYRAKTVRAPCRRCGAALPGEDATWAVRLCVACKAAPPPKRAYVSRYTKKTKTCNRCGVVLTRGNKWCRPCFAEDVHRRVIAKTFGVEKDEYDRLLELQSGRCAICMARPGRARLAVDHDHESGAVRGLLCSRCNNGLGCFSDSPGVMVRAMAYLEAPPAKTRKPIFLTDVVIPDDAVQGRK